MSMDIADMVDDMVQALIDADKLEGMESAQINDLKMDMIIIEQAKWDYTKANLSIKGVQVDDPAGTVETYAGGVGSSTGNLVAAGPPGAPLIAGSVKKLPQTLSQSNDGTGLIE